MKIVKMTTIRAVVTKMSAASTTSLVAGICIHRECDRITPPRPEYCYPFLHVDHLDEGKSDASSQPPVGHDELLLQVDLLQTEPGNF